MFLIFKREEEYLPGTPTPLTHTAFQLERSSGRLSRDDGRRTGWTSLQIKNTRIFSIRHSIRAQRSQVLCVGKCVSVCADPAVVTTAPPFGNNLTPTCILRKVKRERQE